MIGRLWHGWTKREDSDRYEEFVRTEVLPSYYKIPGYKGAYFFRQEGQDETEFVALTFFENMKPFAASPATITRLRSFRLKPENFSPGSIRSRSTTKLVGSW